MNAFETMGVSRPLLKALEQMGIQTPTPIQEMIIPAALEGRDLLAKGKTGSGKTLSYGIPLCERVTWQCRFPQALVLVPTRELALQVKSTLFWLGREKRLQVTSLIGGEDMDRQRRIIRQRNHILVGTPGRVLALLQEGTLNGMHIACLILDEGDLMLDMGFRPDIEKILESLPKVKQRIFCSATLPASLGEICRRYLQQPLYLEIPEEGTPDTIRQEGYQIGEKDPDGEKNRLVQRLLFQKSPERMLIFCGTREMVNVLYRRLSRLGLRCGMLHGMVDQEQRSHTLDHFRQGRFPILIATDVAARGVDIPDITHVLQYDMALTAEAFLHRSGRCGRQGAPGENIFFFTLNERVYMERAQALWGRILPIKTGEALPDFSEDMWMLWKKNYTREKTVQKKRTPYQETRTVLHIGGGQKSGLRPGDFVGAICHLPDVQEEDIGTIEIRDSATYVEILNGKGAQVCEALQYTPIKGRERKVRIWKGKEKEKENK